MDEFEEAVETQELENFLKQDMELADVSQTIGEAELDRLMREMTEEDLDDLVSNMDLNKDVEVLTEPTPTPAASATESTAHKRKSSISEQLFAGVSGLVASAASAVSSTVHKAEDALKHAAEEPASVTAKRAHAAPGSPVATTKVMTLDDMIDATLAKEAVEEDAREAEAKNHKAEAAADIKRKVDALHERVVADKEKVEEKVEEKVASKEAEVKAEAKAGADAEAKPAATAAAAETE
jgi:hypothetical protein